ncbi:MAG: hypothetical protein K6T92_01140 [Candidatus Rokubacteria bacterium]|nr:hypothetical protein [Candidatus Rokubacteria bacterium]
MPAAAEVVCRVLRQAGVGRAFVTAGAPRVLAEAAARTGFDLVPSGAAPAVVMAAVTGVLTGAPGLVVGGAGEPVADALVHALADRAPVILLTGDSAPSGGSVPAAGDPLEGGAGLRTVVAEAASAAHQAAHACQVALRPPGGPVRIAMSAEDGARPAVPVAVVPRPAPAAPPEPYALEEAARLVAGADRPAVVAGLGCREGTAAFWLRAFAEALPAPVVVTRAGRGAMPDAHPLVLGRLGRAEARRVLDLADLVVALGLDPLELGGLPARAPILAIGPGGGEGLPGARHAVAADIALVLEELAPRLVRRSRSDWDVSALERLKRAGRPAPVDGLPAVARLARALGPGVVAACDADERLVPVDEAWEAAAPLDFLIPAAPVEGFAPAAAVAAALTGAGRRALAFTTKAGLLAGRDALAVAAARGLDVGVLVPGSADVEAAGIERLDAAGPAAVAEALGRPGPRLIVVTAPV